MQALGPPDLHVKRDLSKYVNACVRQAQSRAREVPCCRPPVVFGEKVKREGGKRFTGQADCAIAKQFVGQNWKNKNLLCASHGCQEHHNPTGMCNSGLCYHAKSFFMESR